MIDRGRLQAGLAADITVFDKSLIESHCSAKTPRAYASGIAHVLVNGGFAMKNGQRCDSDYGRVLRP